MTLPHPRFLVVH